jgi:hypothetical protein
MIKIPRGELVKLMTPAVMELGKKPLKLKIAMKLTKVTEFVMTESKKYEEVSTARIKELGVKSGEGVEEKYVLDIGTEAYNTYIRELADMDKEEVDFDFDPIPSDELADIVISAVELSNLVKYGVVAE